MRLSENITEMLCDNHQDKFLWKMISKYNCCNFYTYHIAFIFQPEMNLYIKFCYGQFFNVLCYQYYWKEPPLNSPPPPPQNHMVERMWVEVNNRVNYPLKEALVQLQDQEALDMDDNIVRYCTSSLTAKLCKIGIRRAVLAWNAHRISAELHQNVTRSSFFSSLPLF